MILRQFWLKKIEKAWVKKSLIWLTGVRRVGKTSLAKSLEDIEYYDCELNRTRSAIENDAEGFLNSIKKRTLVLDEIHRLENPSELLKIAVDHYPQLKILATGSSTLGASKKFQDTLTDRKIEIRLRALMSEDLLAFKKAGYDFTWDHRFLHGGLPPFYMEEEFPEYGLQEWLDSYWAKDVQELFNLGNKAAFQKFIQLVFLQSGGIFEATSFASPCGVSSPTIKNYLNILQETFVVNSLKPFFSNKAKEIISAPKVYAFDTGMVAYYKNWDSIRDEDRGYMWEHFVLNELIAQLDFKEINYWRDKKKREIDFVLHKRGQDGPIAIETKWQSKNFDAKNLLAFRDLYPEGLNYLVANDISKTYEKEFKGAKVRFVSLSDLVKELG
jgi:uncharacterized protein